MTQVKKSKHYKRKIKKLVNWHVRMFQVQDDIIYSLHRTFGTHDEILLDLFDEESDIISSLHIQINLMDYEENTKKKPNL